jgi:hypothetical protein
MNAKSSYIFNINVKDINEPDEDPFSFAILEQSNALKNKKNLTSKIKTEIINTKLRIVSCTRLGQMDIKIIGEKNSSLLVNSITNESLAIIVTSKNYTEVPYSIIDKDPKKRTISLQIYFPEELHISSLAVIIIFKLFHQFRYQI